MDHRRRQAEFMAPFSRREDDEDFGEFLFETALFDPRTPAHLVTGVSPRTAYLCDDLNTGSGLARSQMNHSPLLTAFFARLDRRDRD